MTPRILAALVLLPVGLAAQGLPIPDDWTWRLDAEQRLVTGDQLDGGDWRFVRMPPGWHITTTDQGGILFPKDRTVTGRWGIEVELFLFPNPSDKPLGIVVEGKDAAPPGSMQLRFLLRRDGAASVEARHGGTDATLVPWTTDSAVKPHAGGVEKYVLRLMHEQETLRFSVNGREMVTVPTGGEDHVAIPGLRVGAGLNLHITRFDLVTPLAPPRPRQPASGQPPGWSIETGALLYTANREGQLGLYMQNGPAGPPRRLLPSGTGNAGRFSPDGHWVVYQARDQGPTDIRVVAADGTGDRELVTHPDWDVLPRWSPDGAQVAFMSSRGFKLGGEDGPFPGHIYVVNSDGTGLTRVTRTPLRSSLGPQDWSPDGRTILLSRETETGLDLFALDVASGAETRLTTDPASEYGAAWSPDGSRIAFHSEAEEVSQLVVMQADGTSRQVLTSGPGLRYGPQWSPDGGWLVFTARGDPVGGNQQYDVLAIRLSDRQVVPVVATSEDEREPHWMPLVPPR